MSTTTIFALVFLLGSVEDHSDLRIVDKFNSPEICNSVLEKVRESEQKQPGKEQLSDKLLCMTITLNSTHKAKDVVKQPQELPKIPETTCKPRVILGKIIGCLNT